MNLTTKKILSSSFIGWIVLGVVCLAYLFTLDGWKPVLRKDRLHFGIDLVGGTYITLDVQTDKAVELELQDKKQSILRCLKAEKYKAPISTDIKKEQLIMNFDNPTDAKSALNLINSKDQTLKGDISGSTLTVYFADSVAKKIKSDAVRGNVEVLKTRLDGLGVGEILVAAHGEKGIIIELPDIDDPQKAKAMIGKPALLEIKTLERTGNSEDDLLDDFDGELPGDLEILPGQEHGRSGKQYFLVQKYTDVTGRLLKNAYAGLGGEYGNEWVVNFEFNPEGGERFHQLTKKNLNRQLAVIVDGVVISAPRVNTPIGGKGYIHGDFTDKSAKELAALLKSGAFVAPVTFAEERTIGPSLGAESIRQGLIACAVGLGLLVIFSIAMYSVAGFFAFLTLLFNLLLILVALVWLKATLTLPGIAGMVLTTGMAIDASILIYEKIRDELAGGSPWRKAVQSGFSDAMVVILDSNITTFIVGVVLYKFGTGPIRGFAVTMMVGIISTLLTGLFFLRSVFDFALYNLGFQRLKI